jgi:Uma2 family endonuclease
MAFPTAPPVPTPSPTRFATVADLLDQLGGVPAERVRLHPWPGTAEEKDVIEAEERENRLCELIDGVLVEKTMGFFESWLAAALIILLGDFATRNRLGIVTGADGTIRLAAGLVRIPDVSFVSWDRLPGGKIPREPIPDLAPDLAVEVLSKSNTKREMERKLRDYFDAGVRLVWFIEPEDRTARVYTAIDRVESIGEDGALEGGDVLPGFRIPLRDLFARAERPEPR